MDMDGCVAVFRPDIGAECIQGVDQAACLALLHRSADVDASGQVHGCAVGEEKTQGRGTFAAVHRVFVILQA